MREVCEDMHSSQAFQDERGDRPGRPRCPVSKEQLVFHGTRVYTDANGENNGIFYAISGAEDRRV